MVKTLKFLRKTVEDGNLQLNIPVEVPNTTVEIIVVMNVMYKGKQKRYDVSDLAGRLRWKGDAIMEQRRLRDEW